MDKDEYIKMLYDRTEYLKSEIADFEQCNGEVEQARLWAIKEQVSRIFGLLNECDKDLFPDTIRCEKTEQEYIQTCNTEQLAEWIVHQTLIALLENQNNHSLRMTYPAYWVEWLKQPHTNKE